MKSERNVLKHKKNDNAEKVLQWKKVSGRITAVLILY